MPTRGAERTRRCLSRGDARRTRGEAQEPPTWELDLSATLLCAAFLRRHAARRRRSLPEVHAALVGIQSCQRQHYGVADRRPRSIRHPARQPAEGYSVLSGSGVKLTATTPRTFKAPPTEIGTAR